MLTTRMLYTALQISIVSNTPTEILWKLYPGPWSVAGRAWLLMLHDAHAENARRGGTHARSEPGNG